MRRSGSGNEVAGGEDLEVAVNLRVCEDPAKETDEHLGADGRIIDAFIRYLDNPSVSPETSVDTGLEAMLSAGGIELAREEQRVVELDD